MTLPDLDLLIVGGGIAGWSAAHVAARRGRHVTVVDEGVHRASDLPIALVNPLRGHAGRLVPRGVEGMVATFDLIDRLRADGHAIAAGRGLHRPLVDVQGDLLGEAYWRTRIAGRLDFEFFTASPPGLGLVEAPPTLFLPQAELVAPAAVRLADGALLRARSVLWCGGAWGAHGLDTKAAIGERSATPADAAIYKPGSLAMTAERLTDAPMTFGLYATPWSGGKTANCTLIGPTREDATSTFSTDDSNHVDDAIARLQDRARRVFGGSITLTSAWRGVRLARLSADARHALRDVASLTALGSRGFLMAPLLAGEWAASL